MSVSKTIRKRGAIEFSCALMAAFLVSTALGQTWEIEVVDAAGGLDPSLVLDGSGYPHISHIGGDLKYAWRDASGWHFQVADAGGGLRYTSLALDASGNPRISYHAQVGQPSYADLKYAYRDASGWHTQTVDIDMGYDGAGTSLALDASGWPSISYYDAENYDLKYAWLDASGWHTEAVDTPDYQGWGSSLELDGTGHPHISYGAGPPNSDLKYAYKDGTGWHIQTVDAAGYVGTETSLALDGSGWPHISYSDDGNRNLKYAWRDVSGWHTQIVDAAGNVGWYTSLALDTSGYPHISYSYDDGTGLNSDLKYAYRDASGWRTQTVDSTEGRAGEGTSLALDGSGYPHIGYRDVTNQDLKYAYVPAPPSLVLGGELMGGELQLTWGTVTQASAYWVYGASNLPWFVPGGAPGYQYRIEVLPQGTTTWSSAAGIGDPAVNWTYLVMAVNALNLEVTRSNRVGEEDYQADIP